VESDLIQLSVDVIKSF